MEKLSLNIPNISCGHCVRAIQDELGEQPGVRSVDGNPEDKEVTVRFEAPASPERIRAVLAEINYPAVD